MKSAQEQKEMLSKARGIAKYFKIELTISIFGYTVVHWVYPPEKE